MRCSSFFSGRNFAGQTLRRFYFYGNQPGIMAFRWSFLRWWFAREGFRSLEVETLDSILDTPSLFGPAEDRPCLVWMKKAPKVLEDILTSRHACVWQASSTKNALHEGALRAPQIGAFACYEIKADEVLQALIFYLHHEFNKDIPAGDLKDLALALSHDPAFFFSEAFKCAMGAGFEGTLAAASEEDIMGPLRLQSAMVLRQMKTSPTELLWKQLGNLRHQEVIFKSGSAATEQLLAYYSL